jgi:hypothetical protein
MRLVGEQTSSRRKRTNCPWERADVRFKLKTWLYPAMPNSRLLVVRVPIIMCRGVIVQGSFVCNSDFQGEDGYSDACESESGGQMNSPV